MNAHMIDRGGLSENMRAFQVTESRTWQTRSVGVARRTQLCVNVRTDVPAKLIQRAPPDSMYPKQYKARDAGLPYAGRIEQDAQEVISPCSSSTSCISSSRITGLSSISMLCF